MSTPTREDYERTRTEAVALRVMADAALEFQRALDDAYPSLGEWEQGWAYALSRAAADTARDAGERATLGERVAASKRSEREADAHLAALNEVDDLEEADRGRPARYAGEVQGRDQLPEPVADNLQGETRVYAVYEEPMAVAVEGDAEWDLRERR